MSTDPTEAQGGHERRQSREMSLQRGHPPTEVPGYEPERFLGMGAYGEVWVARERNTGRRVAIKYYAHRGGLDWSLLSREVEKLAFLFADRYVVQLLGVGWDADPPYYIMEYLERGSLAERLQQGPIPVAEAVSLFHDVAMGLVHAHGKGVLHCDVKPANVLLDQDGRPRLADFGQSRLSHEQIPALGTLFYMAPEQADLEAVPDARWDVYALGALLYCMLTGGPPHRTGRIVSEFEKTPKLVKRLTRYRELIEKSPIPTAHRHVRGADRELCEIIDRCLAADPSERFPNVQSVIDALDKRAARRARRPLMMLGTIGPALLLAVMAWFAWQGFGSAVDESDAALTDRALKSNRFAAKFVARTAGNELERRYQAVEDLARQVAASDGFRRLLADVQADPELQALAREINEPEQTVAKQKELCREFGSRDKPRDLQEEFTRLLPKSIQGGEVASCFFCDKRGIAMVRLPESETLGKNYAWRSYYHGGLRDGQDRQWRPDPGDRLDHTHLSAVFPSQATSQWIVAVSAPVVDRTDGKEEFLGVVALTVELGRFVELQHGDGSGGKERLGDEQFAVLVDWREDDNKGVILQHPFLSEMLDKHKRLPNRLKDDDYRVRADDLPSDGRPIRQRDYPDPLQADEEGKAYRKHWLARMEEVRVRGEPTGWIVIVQEARDTAIGATLSQLRIGLLRYGLIALLLVSLVMLSLWKLASRMSVKK